MDTVKRIGSGWNIGLWVAQGLLSVVYGFIGFTKLTQPIEKLVSMQIKWAGDEPVLFVRALGALELLGAIGLILPSLVRIQPRLTVAAAFCFTILQLLAIGFHATRGETSQTLGLNVVLLAFSLFIYWGRSSKSAIQSN